ncbi:MAG: hypothetical protein E6J33_06645 [Chloroflexi bacterium]|nr:MAG: hypothetical protein E6J33_06645 [Chloroflexota bacterium]
MTTKQTIAPPTPPNVKINSPISQKNLSHFRTHFPKNLSHLVQNPPSPQICDNRDNRDNRDNCDNCDNCDNQPTVGADLSRTPPIYRPSVDLPVSDVFCETSLSALRFRSFAPNLFIHPPTPKTLHPSPPICYQYRKPRGKPQ